MKKYVLGTVAILMAIAFSAFTRPVKLKATEQQWYYTGSTTADQNDPEAYEKLTAQDVSLCDGSGSVRCVIEAPEHLDNQGQPDGTPNLSMASEISFKP